jgi:ligand-binding sensor domain-containing protein
MKLRQLRLILIGFLCWSTIALYAQSDIPIESWRTHFSYQDSRIVINTSERIYVAAQYGLFYLDKADNSLRVISKSDGLSDVGVTAMEYDENVGLILAYRSGVVDLVSEQGIFAFTLISEEADTPETIYDILIQDNLVYLSTSVGVRVLSLELDQEEPWQIQESYTRLSELGEALPIYQSTILRDSLFLGTQAGVIANSLDPLVNRQDFNTWRRFDVSQGIPNEAARFLIAQEEQLYAAVDQRGVYHYDGQWQSTAFATDVDFNALQSSAYGVLIVSGGDIFRLNDANEVIAIENSAIRFAQDVAEENETLWIADQQQGLLRLENNQAEQFLPNGPASNNIHQLRYLNGTVIALKQDALGAYYQFSEGRWQNYTELPITSRFTDATFSEVTQQYYFSSLGEGILQWDGGESFSVINQLSSGSTLENDQVSALVDSEDRLWLANYNALASLHTIDLSDDSWQQLTFNRTQARYPRQLRLDFRQQVWMLIGGSDLSRPGNDLLIFDPTTNENLLISEVVNASQLPGRQLTDMAIDLDGQLWLMGSEGVAYFPVPEQVLEEPLVVKPVFDRQFLLLGEFVTAVAVDGGNRKWIGTNSGLWLFSETGEELVYQFTTENSPLISDVILDIAVDDQSGEVFVATDRGVVSFRSTATRGNFSHQSVKLFPNPVRQGFDGLVGMQGLVNQATVKITTVSGVLVQELQAEGGTATWDLRAYTGDHVQSGVYLVFSASTDGSETFVGKIAVVP